MKFKNFGENRRVSPLTVLVAMVVMISGCSQQSDDVLSVEAKEAKPPALDADVEAAERPYFEAARPFAAAISARDYAKAYEYLSSQAKGRMSPNQFVAPNDDSAYNKGEAGLRLNVTAEQFASMMSATEKEYGRPAKLSQLDVFSTERVVLSGRATSTEDKLDAMFAIGMMPPSIHPDSRKASLRSKLGVELSPEQLAESAKALQMTVEKLKADPDFQPSITLKVVMVEEAGTLKVGYFEFLPPGIWD
jgi:hypothetical protein